MSEILLTGEAETGMSVHGAERMTAARVGMAGLIVAEASLFAVFVVAYLYDLGKSLSLSLIHI